MCRAQRQKIKLLEEGGADEQAIINARARYVKTSDEYVNFSKSVGLSQQWDRVTVGGKNALGSKLPKKAESVNKITAKNVAKFSKYSIIKKVELPTETNTIKSMSPETKELISKSIDSVTAEYDVHIDGIVSKPLGESDKNVPFQFQPIRGSDGSLIKHLVINTNYDFMGSQENFQKRILKNYDKGVLASNSVEGLISHELAHIMTFQDVSTYTGYLLRNKEVAERYIFGVSKYANASLDGSECIAEAFAKKDVAEP